MAQQLKIETIIFDLDGTLIDTEQVAANVLQEMLKKHGISALNEDLARVAGVKWSVALDHLFEILQLKFDRPKFETELFKEYRNALDQTLPVILGGADAVKDLAAEFKMGLVSGSNRGDIEFALKKMAIFDCFDCVLGAEDYVQSKPSPEGFKKALHILGQKNPKKALIFEDSKPGIQSGIDAGAWVCAIEVANHFGHDQSQAHLKINDLSVVNRAWVHTEMKQFI